MTTAINQRGVPPARAPGAPPRFTLRADPRWVLGLIAAGALATVVLWWHGTPSVHGFGDWLTNAGRLTGLWAGYGVVVLVALMARLPPLEHGLGADRLARWHAMGGRYTVWLIVAHALLITWGYAVTAHTGLVSQTKSLLTSYPDVLMATGAGLLFVGVGLVSARAARRRMRYETWYYLHFYTYLAIALAFSHQFADGAQFVSSLPARVFWSAMYLAVTAMIIWYRVLTPIRQAYRHQLRVVEVQPEAPDVVSILIAGWHLDELRAESGQFFRWRFLTRDLWWTSSPYSLSAPPGPHALRITVKALGGHSAALARLRPGTRVFAEGPYGALTAAVRRKKRVLLIAGGVGITPLRALFESLPASAGDLTFIYRVSNPEDAVFMRELEQLATQRRAALWLVTGTRADLGGDPLTAGRLAKQIPGLTKHDIYLCGPPGLTGSVMAELRAAGVRPRQIHHESFEF